MGWIDVPGENDRRDLEAFVRRLSGMDEAAALRIVSSGGALRLWARTPFGPLATRVVVGTADAQDQVVLAGVLAQGLPPAPDAGGRIELGFPSPSAWQGMLPPAGGFEAVELVGAQEILDLAEKGRGVAADESGPLGVAPSLLEQEVIAVGGEDAPRLGVEMRLVFALTGLGFVPSHGGTSPAGERVRIAARGPWIRLDARYGSIFHRPESLPLDVVR